jgi:hypothetical protein
MMGWPLAMLTVGALLGASLVMLCRIWKVLLAILTEMQKRNYIEELTQQVMRVTPIRMSSSPTKTTAPFETSNPLDESGQQKHTH